MLTLWSDLFQEQVPLVALELLRAETRHDVNVALSRR
jgi:hypothetical protein